MSGTKLDLVVRTYKLAEEHHKWLKVFRNFKLNITMTLSPV
jgi:hypothetical protein